MYRIYAHYEAYRTDDKGRKFICQRGIVRLETPDNQINGANLKASVVQQVTRQYPELEGCLILMGAFGYEIEDEREAA